MSDLKALGRAILIWAATLTFASVACRFVFPWALWPSAIVAAALILKKSE